MAACPFNGDVDLFQNDPHWRDLILFNEYFHGDNGSGVGASHQTGWTAMVCKMINQLSRYSAPAPRLMTIGRQARQLFLACRY